MGSLNHVNNNRTVASLCQVHNPDFSRAEQGAEKVGALAPAPRKTSSIRG